MTAILSTKKPKMRTSNKGALFFYLTLLTFLFLCLEVSYFIHYSGFYLADVTEVSSHLTIPAKIIPPVLLFISIQLALHFLFIVFIWGISLLIGVALSYSENQVEKTGFILWGLGVATIIFSNQYYYPNSNFCALTKHFVSYTLAGDLSFIFLISLCFATLIAFVGVLKIICRMPKVMIALAVLGIISIAYSCYNKVIVTFKDTATEDKPNIIIVGIDSLRPDFLGFFGATTQTPFLDNFLNHSTVFTESLTPLARTFPAWVSILSGEYPKQSGMRTNLDDQRHLNEPEFLPDLLRKQGYETIFATDEARFSNIDQQFGFDHVITPPIGLNDFLLGTINDFPLSNLLVNTKLGKWLFPYSYGNRPVFATYDPDSFLQLLKPAVTEVRNKPVFMVVHFCLPHFPYLYGSMPLNDKSIFNYQMVVQRVDQQIHDFMRQLEKNKILEHAIVIVLSDHGEAIELRGDRATDPDLFISNKLKSIPHFYPPMLETEKVDESAGHGTDVLGLPQYHTLLAFRLFGLQKNQTNVIPGRVSLLDIKPTILNLLGLHFQSDSGDSLKENIIGNKSLATSIHEDFFVESDFSPEAIRTVHPETRNVLFEGINFYKIDPITTRVIVKDSMRQLILSSKQYADFYGEWVLALYPQNNHVTVPILVNLKTGEWTNDLKTQFALQSPAQHMLGALQQFYGDDLASF
jgi:hypothetical protein